MSRRIDKTRPRPLRSVNRKWLLCWRCLLIGLFAGIGPGARAELYFGGQGTLRYGYARTAPGSLFRNYLGESAHDGSAELRLITSAPLSQDSELQAHYEIVSAKNPLWDISSAGQPELFLGGSGIPDDSRRLLDLTHSLDDQGAWRSYHRLDRLSYTLRKDWGTLVAGRSAITWGNGLVFNPMDLFNPFAPTDVERDYKLGDDLLLLTLYPGIITDSIEWQLLAVPRRNPATGDLDEASSSLALKAHLAARSSEWDLLAAWHYDEPVLGLGHVGYLGSAVYRMDFTAAFPESGDPLFSSIANIDYSWTWNGMNYYGSLEFHYNNIGVDDYRLLPGSPRLLERLDRGEIHTLGRTYLAPALQIELHPLLNFHLASILNIADPSGVLLPRLVWNIRQSIEGTLGASVPFGPHNSEFGGFRLSPGAPSLEPQSRLYLWVKAFF